MNGAHLKITELTKRFGGLVAVNKVDLEALPGSIVGLIGPNGAGKTTVFNLISGFYKPDEGQIFLDGTNIVGWPPYLIAEKGVGRTFQNIRLFRGRTVGENVKTALHRYARYSLLEALLYLPRVRGAERELEQLMCQIIELTGLTNFINVPAESLPYGLRRRLEIARALALKPRLLLLDEPAAGLNPGEVIELVQFIRSIRDKFGLTIVVIEHHMDLVTSLCEMVTVMNFGQVIAKGTPSEIQKNPVVVEAYLGKEAKRAAN